MNEPFRKWLSTFLLCGVVGYVTNSQVRLVDVSSEANVQHTHISGAFLGGGAAFVDVNRDGFLDLIALGGQEDDILFLNQADGTFVTDRDALKINSYKIGTTSALAYGDLDNDGCDEIFITTLENSQGHYLLKGDCNGQFSDISTFSGIDKTGPGTGVIFFDFDNDGLLDIYVIHYIDEPGFIRNESGEVVGYDHQCHPNHLYRNLGNLQFEEISEAMNASGRGCGLAAQVIHTSEQESGIYIANDFGQWLYPNEYLVFDPVESKFTDLAPSKGLDIGMFGMGIATSDLNSDGKEEVYVTNIGPNAYLVPDDQFYFDRAKSWKIEDAFTINGENHSGWGVMFIDLENDSDLDLVVANGEIPSAPFLEVAEESSSSIYLNQDNSFTQSTSEISELSKDRNRGLVSGDMDNDGDLDLFLTTTALRSSGDPANEPIDHRSSILFENRHSNNDANYLSIRLEGVNVNRSAYGSKIVVHFNDGKLIKWLESGGSHASQSSNDLHYGLNEETADSVMIYWPNGTSNVVRNPILNQKLLITEGRDGYDVLGCMDRSSSNYNEFATISEACKELTTSVDESFQTEVALIYPTIAYSSVFVKNQTGKHINVTVHDLNGREILGRRFDHIGKVETLDISNLSPGAYIVVVNVVGGDAQINQTILKQ